MSNILRCISSFEARISRHCSSVTTSGKRQESLPRTGAGEYQSPFFKIPQLLPSRSPFATKASMTTISQKVLIITFAADRPRNIVRASMICSYSYCTSLPVISIKYSPSWSNEIKVSSLEVKSLHRTTSSPWHVPSQVSWVMTPSMSKIWLPKYSDT